jgi:hypothetical protein
MLLGSIIGIPREQPRVQVVNERGLNAIVPW